MLVHVGDMVEVDRLGLPHHGSWGIVHQVEEAEAVVQLEPTKRGTYWTTHAAVRFETWELRVLRCINDRRSGE